MYMAPEAITSPASVDARADLYALAAVAYFLLTGHTVFEGNTVMDVCAQHLHEAPVPPSERAGRALDPGLEALLLKCLEKNPDDRVQSARELSRALLDLPIRTWTEADAQDAWVDWTAPPESSAEPTALRVSLDARDDQFLSPSK